MVDSHWTEIGVPNICTDTVMMESAEIEHIRYSASKGKHLL